MKKHKCFLYKKEQEEIINKIINILNLDNNSIILYNLDNDEYKKNNIMALVPDILKYFCFSNSIGAKSPLKAKRPYVSIIRQFTKTKYNIISSDYKLKLPDNTIIRTKKYTFIQI